MGMEVPGKRRRGRPKRRWLDSIRNDLSERELAVKNAQDWPRWRRLSRHIDPTQKWEKMKKNKFWILGAMNNTFHNIFNVRWNWLGRICRSSQ